MRWMLEMNHQVCQKGGAIIILKEVISPLVVSFSLLPQKYIHPVASRYKLAKRFVPPIYPVFINASQPVIIIGLLRGRKIQSGQIQW